MRTAITVAAVLLAGQAMKAQQAPAAKPPENPPAQAQEAPATQAEAVPPAAPEQQITGSLDAGYRWVHLGKGSSEDIYRSLVNLGEGPKLFGADISVRRPNGRYYQRLDARATSWGGDPYNTARLDASKAGVYNFRFDYRNVSYFNSIPSFANPFLGQGVLFSERSLDTQRRLIDTELELRPGAHISPYLAYYHSSGFGRGVTTFVSEANEFPVATRLRDATDSYRGGVRLNFTRLNITLEQGGTTFKDDQQAGFTGSNPGNRRVPLLGQDIVLRDLAQAYGARGDGIFERAVLEARPWSKLSFTGQFLYSKPSLDVKYLQQNGGNFILLDTLQLYTGQLDRSLAEANRPRSSGSWTTEIHPLRRVRVLESWFTDRFHVAGGSFLARTLTAPSTDPVQSQASVADRLVLNLNQHQVDAIVDVAPWLTLRGGHRYEWGDAVSLSGVRLLPNAEAAELRRQVALAGATWRRGANLDFNADVEASAGDHTFFRTDLADYQRARLRGRYRARSWMAWTASFAILNNQNPARGISFDYQSRQSSVALALTPAGGRRWSLLLDYMRGTVRSTLPYLVPEDRTSDLSRYRDDGHYGGASAEIHVWRGTVLNLGGSFAVVAGSRPTRYYQPQARFQVPIRGKVAWTGEWRWFGFTERRYAFENFHANLFSMGLHIGL